jgi:tetratricopeptide (TPR) repeat protein
MKTAVTLMALFAAVVGLQAVQARRQPLGLPTGISGNLLYLRSPEFVKRAALSFDALAADAYWIRTVQHYGRTKLSTEPGKQYDLLNPLLDLTTSLDPYFDVAYSFGAVFLAEQYPAGAGRPDQAIALLHKGLSAQPQKWQLARDLGFVYYWWVHDYPMAAEWFRRAAAMPNAPTWLAPLAAVTLAQGGNRVSSRALWTELLNNPDLDWVRKQAQLRLTQLDAMDQIAALEGAIESYRVRAGSRPQSWQDLIRGGVLRGIPIDPTGHPYRIDAVSGAVTLAPDSPLNPLPTTTTPTAPRR